MKVATFGATNLEQRKETSDSELRINDRERAIKILTVREVMPLYWF